jgi:hypothetical protein
MNLTPAQQWMLNMPYQTQSVGTMLTGTNLPYYERTGGMPSAPAAAAAADGGTFMQGFAPAFAEGMTVAGPIVSIFGAASSAIGSYYAAESQKNALKMQAQNQRFQAEMARINRQGAEFTAAQVGREGAMRAGIMGMRAGQARAGARASLAARGAVLGAGSAREIIGSMDLMAEIDRLTISASTVREQEAARLAATNLGAQATMAGISARNLEATAGTIYPGMALGTSLLGSATEIGSTWARNRRIEELLAGVGTQRI